MAKNSDYSNISPNEAVLRLNEILFSNNPDAAISNEQLKEAQSLLNIAGFNAGRADGFEGPDTGNALALFIYESSTPIYNEDNPDGRINTAIAGIVETYATAENVQKYQQMYGPIRHTNEITEELNKEDLETVERLLNAPITEKNTIGLQQALENLGRAPGSIDGDFGPKTAGASLSYLADNYDVLLSMNSDNLEFILNQASPDDIVNFQTQLQMSPPFYDLLRSKIDAVDGPLEAASRDQLLEIQQLMTAAGYYNRGIDGIWGSGTRAGLEEFNNTTRPTEIEPLAITITPQKPVEEVAEPVIEVAKIEAEPTESASENVSPEVLQTIYDRLSAINPKIVELAGIETKFTYGNIMRSVEAEATYEIAFDNDDTTMVELSELDVARMVARSTFEFPFEQNMFSQENAEQMVLEIERMENGLHPKTNRPIREVEVNGDSYLISSIAEDGYSLDFNTKAQIIPVSEDNSLAVNSAQPLFVENLTA